MINVTAMPVPFRTISLMTKNLFNGEGDDVAKRYMGFLNMHCFSTGNTDGNVGVAADLTACLAAKGNRANACGTRYLHRADNIF